ncbi:MAG: NUDIX domain-containing protein [Candidatus Dojkabacteria bacterium]|jgi:8-oxo-dGTP pyrophosphatase MutT (NUDIX family)|nr:NUDIX domain-containing protein [Candidatus Dojkabacteria bacterium]MDD4561407.1 NUDIX domain-containing protein [Candidatus Dojkabacteria bacterium]
MDEFREDADLRINNIQSRGIILKGNNVLVMFRRKEGREYYVFPGGHMRKGETPLENATREIEEETTVIVRDLEIAFEYTSYVKPKKEEKEYYFVGYWDSGIPTLSGEESRRANENNFYKPMWIPISKIHTLNLYPLMTKEWVENSLEKFIEERK